MEKLRAHIHKHQRIGKTTALSKELHIYSFIIGAVIKR